MLGLTNAVLGARAASLTGNLYNLCIYTLLPLPSLLRYLVACYLYTATFAFYTMLSILCYLCHTILAMLLLVLLLLPLPLLLLLLLLLLRLLLVLVVVVPLLLQLLILLLLLLLLLVLFLILLIHVRLVQLVLVCWLYDAHSARLFSRCYLGHAKVRARGDRHRVWPSPLSPP